MDFLFKLTDPISGEIGYHLPPSQETTATSFNIVEHAEGKIIEIQISGKLSKEAYGKCLPETEAKIKEFGEVRVLFLLPRACDRYSCLSWACPTSNWLPKSTTLTRLAALKMLQGESGNSRHIGLNFDTTANEPAHGITEYAEHQEFDLIVLASHGHTGVKERLFVFGRCIVHFAVDDQQVKMCTHLKGKKSWFLPFNQGWNDGAGNPPNPNGLKTDYLWKRVLTPGSTTNIVENYAQIVVEKNKKTGQKTRKQIFPRYHQLDLVRGLLENVRERGVEVLHTGRHVLAAIVIVSASNRFKLSTLCLRLSSSSAIGIEIK